MDRTCCNSKMGPNLHTIYNDGMRSNPHVLPEYHAAACDFLGPLPECQSDRSRG